MKKIVSLLMFLFLLSSLTFLACEIQLSQINIEGGDFTIEVGETKQLNIITTPENAVIEKPLFASSTPTVISISDDGIVTALKAGESVITAAVYAKTSSITVTVIETENSNQQSNPSDGISITNRIKTIGVNQTYQLSIDDKANDNDAKFVSSNPTIIDITQHGEITAKKTGTAFISVINSLGKSDSMKVHVIDMLPIIPEPKNIDIHAGEFSINNKTTIENVSSLNLSPQIAIFKNQIATSSGITLHEGNATTNVIKLISTNENKNNEWYKIEVTHQAITITAKQNAGFFYAFQTILQTLPPEVYSKTQKSFSLDIPCYTIDDEPRFSHRGLLVDVSRHIYDISTLKTIIDEISKTKMNIFHWHLTDDGGFRFPFEGIVKVGSKSYDLGQLIKKTSYRTGNEYAFFPQSWHFFDPTDPLDPWYEKRENMHGGCYTKEQIKDFINYCQDRGVTVIPEIDMPGHSKPLYMFFEDLRCDKLGGSGVPASVPQEKKLNNITNDICASSEATLPILKEMIRQVADTFPSEIIHIGADEVHLKTNMWYNLGPWWFCSRCENKIKSLVGPTASVNYNNLQILQAYIIKELEKEVIANGKRCALWNEGIRGNFTPDPSTILWYWNGIDDLNKGLNNNMQIINCDQWFYYTALYQHQSDRNEKNPVGQDWGGSAPTVTLQYVYNADTSKAKNGNTSVALKNQGGSQICMWSEKLVGFSKNGKTYSQDEHLIYMLFPRVFALAESTWTLADKKDYDKFYNKMQIHFKRLDNAGIDCYATHYKE